jgi:hypothetical protein
MTPLAQFLTRQILARPKDRIGMWRDAGNIELLQEQLVGIHCFETTACVQLAMELCNVGDSQRSSRMLR